ncbi:MAG: dihydrofolate reductase family protein [Patescibacteria group bacterium]
MKVILDATISPNGFISRENFEEDFLPDSGWDAFKESVASAGNFIIGRHTYEIIEPEHFDSIEATRIVVSSQNLDIRPTFTLAESPKVALKLLEDQGFEEALIGGGSGLNSSFMKAGLVDELVFYVVPYVIGKGTPVFTGDFEAKLEFISNKPFAEGFISRYRVVK